MCRSLTDNLNGADAMTQLTIDTSGLDTLERSTQVVTQELKDDRSYCSSM